jgi:hypothetical protein
MCNFIFKGKHTDHKVIRLLWIVLKDSLYAINRADFIAIITLGIRGMHTVLVKVLVNI